MVIALSNLTTGTSASNGPWTTASISPGGNNLILLTISIRNGASTNPATPTVSGNSLTWVLINSITYDPDSTSRKTLFLFRAMGASPSSGAVTITNAETDTNAEWSIDQATGISTSGSNGSGAIVQSVTNSDTSGTGAGLTVTLAAFSNANNSTYGVFSNDGPTVWTKGTNFTSTSSWTSSNTDGLTEFEIANDTAVTATCANVGGNRIGGIAIEIAIAPATIVYGGSVPNTSVREQITISGY